MVRVAQGVFLGRELGHEATERKECSRQLSEGGREGRKGLSRRLGDVLCLFKEQQQAW